MREEPATSSICETSFSFLLLLCARLKTRISLEGKREQEEGAKKEEEERRERTTKSIERRRVEAATLIVIYALTGLRNPNLAQLSNVSFSRVPLSV